VVGCHSVAAGLAACHSRGVVHQDIRPANILLTTDGVHCKVADFGSVAPTHIGSKLNPAQTCM
jgi:serine/threonine protein kinase